jgi:hypothetical protein
MDYKDIVKQIIDEELRRNDTIVNTTEQFNEFDVILGDWLITTGQLDRIRERVQVDAILSTTKPYCLKLQVTFPSC